MYVNEIRILLKSYLPISPMPPTKLKEILDEVRNAIQITTLDYVIVIKRLHMYYNMNLVTFCINKERNLIVQFPIFLQLYIQNNIYHIKLKQCYYLLYTLIKVKILHSPNPI